MVLWKYRHYSSTVGIFGKALESSGRDWGDIFSIVAIDGERFQGRFGSVELIHSTGSHVLVGGASCSVWPKSYPARLYTQTSTLGFSVCFWNWAWLWNLSRNTTLTNFPLGNFMGTKFYVADNVKSSCKILKEWKIISEGILKIS